MTRYGTSIAACWLAFALLTHVDASAQQTVTVQETDWQALSDASVYYYEWYDPADLPAIRAWVDGDAAELPPKVHHPLVTQDENGVYRPNGPDFYPQEVFEDPYGFGADPANWIDDPGLFAHGPFEPWYTMPGWGDEIWWFIHPHHLYAIAQQDGRFQSIDPLQILHPDDQPRYQEYAENRDRLEALRADYRALVRNTFDGYDLERIRDALRENAAATVVLDGDFYIGRTLTNGHPEDSRFPHFLFDLPDSPWGLWEVDWEFTGTLRGEGDASIRTLPGATFEAPVMVVLAFDPRLGPGPASITIADLSFVLTEPNTQFIHHGIPSNYGSILVLPAHMKSVDMTLENVEATGLISDEIYGGWPGRSPIFGIALGGIVQGTVDLYNVTVRNTSFPVFPTDLIDSTFTMGGSPSKGGLLENNIGGVGPFWLEGTTCDISYNTTHDAPIFSAQGWQDPEASPNTYLVRHNDVHVEGSDWAGIEMHGPPGNENTVVIRHNTITSYSHIFPWGLLFSRDNNDVVMANNTFIGAGPFATYHDVMPDVYDVPSEGHGWAIYGNHYRRFDAEVADMWLGSGSSDFTVVGQGTDTVLDLGTDNVLVGVINVETGKHSHPSPGNPPALGLLNHKSELASRIGVPR